MNRTIESNLESIIPRHSGALPKELKELTASLLAQSRTKCNLGPEEEVARTYLCAHLACERLKTTLNLPPIESRPPIAPRAYAKLYRYFDTQLQTSAARAKAQRSAKIATPSKPLPQRGTLNKEQSFKSFSASTPTKASISATYRTPKKGLKFRSNTEKEKKIPKWVIPAIRLVCREMGTPKASPHITAGVETLLTLPCPKPETEVVVSEEKANGKIPALIASVWFFVVVEMRGKAAKGVETSDRQAKVRDALNKAKEEEESFILERVGEDEDAWRGWEDIGARDVLVWSKEIGSRGWKEMDWFLNVPEGTGVDGDVPEKEEVVEELDPERGEDDEDDLDARERRELGVVHQKKYDYLSARNKAEYKAWKEEILVLAREKWGDEEDTEMVDA